MATQPACCLAPQPMTRIFERPFAPSATPMLSCTTHAVVGCRSHAPTHLFASSSAHACLIFSLFSLAASRFSLVRSRRSPRRHMLTLYFASLQLPVTFHRKPRAWHSSRAATTSAQPGDGVSSVLVLLVGRWVERTLLHLLGVEMGMHLEETWT